MARLRCVAASAFPTRERCITPCRIRVGIRRSTPLIWRSLALLLSPVWATRLSMVQPSAHLRPPALPPARRHLSPGLEPTPGKEQVHKRQGTFLGGPPIILIPHSSPALCYHKA